MWPSVHVAECVACDAPNEENKCPRCKTFQGAFQPAHVSGTEPLMPLSFILPARAFTPPHPPSVYGMFTLNSHLKPGFCTNLLTSHPFVGCALGGRDKGERGGGGLALAA